jgi:N-acetylmuramoyl-L-alanine amidase
MKPTAGSVAMLVAALVSLGCVVGCSVTTSGSAQGLLARPVRTDSGDTGHRTGPANRGLTRRHAIDAASARRREPLVVLDPGHNGGNATHTAEISRLVPAGFGRVKACNTTGTATDAGYPEHAYTWDVVQRIRRILQKHHIRVLMTRHSDRGVGPCVNRRAAIESTKGVSAAIAIHGDGAPSAGHGFHICTASRRPAHATARTMARSHEMAVKIHNALLGQNSGLVPSTYIGHDGYFPRSDEAGLNLSSKPTTFLELGNMRNAHDAALQSSPRGREHIAHAVAIGIINYLRWLHR